MTHLNQLVGKEVEALRRSTKESCRSARVAR
jgi:hypothetical protein